MYTKSRDYDDRRRYDSGPPPRSYPPARSQPPPAPYYPPRDYRDDHRDYASRSSYGRGPPRDPYATEPSYSRPVEDDRYRDSYRDVPYGRERTDSARAWEAYYRSRDRDEDLPRARDSDRSRAYEDSRGYAGDRRPPRTSDERRWDRRPSHSPPRARKPGMCCGRPSYALKAR
jgi:hypothetical protein